AARAAGVSVVVSATVLNAPEGGGAQAWAEGSSEDGEGAWPTVYRAVGFHPWYARPGNAIDNLRRAMAGTEAYVALGEMGLDAGQGRPPLDVQEEVLEAQLKLAAELDVPIVLHVHRAHEALLATLRDHAGVLRRSGKSLRGTVHGFSRGPELARRYIDLGLAIGLGAGLFDARAQRLQATAREIPLAHLVLESDAPSAEIADVPGIAQALARLRGLDLETVAKETTQNARRLYAIT
ncbi:MAG: TatD family hydrolase, partial [Deltaproteobacteria bacterium]|nr:TatD family hydrolase [Deltaproteobacteria bacterium]